MNATDRPRIRPFLAAAQDTEDQRFVHVWDRIHISKTPLRVTVQEFTWIQAFNGENSLRDIQYAAMQSGGGVLFPIEIFAQLAQRLDDNLFLDGPRFRERLADPIREPSCIGCYPEDPNALRTQLHGLFAKGPGQPSDARKSDGALHSALIPHIDYARGGLTYAWGFKEVFERADADLFVVIGTSHYSPCRFTLTRKNFKTPFGVVPTDQQFIDRLVGHYGDGLFADEFAHLPEHSIELEVVFLQYLYENRRPIRIVPLVVGSFQDCVEDNSNPAQRDDIKRMISSLQKTEAETGERICYIISGDLAHIGPKFGDPNPVADPVLSHSKKQDHLILEEAGAVSSQGYFDVIAEEGDCRRICGLPPTYTILEGLQPSKAKLLHYDQYVHPRGHESVSFASMAFYR